MNIRISAILGSGLLLCWSAVAQDNTSAPTQITTADGRTYQNVSVQRVDPDGLLVSYQPQASGLGVAKLKFRDLPDSVREQYKYDADRAKTFEQQQTQANAQWQSQLSSHDWFARYRALAELNRSLAGDAYVSYTTSLDPTGRVAAQGFTGGVLPYNYYLPGFVPYEFYGRQPNQNLNNPYPNQQGMQGNAQTGAPTLANTR
jgi:hypothetical protein